MTTRKNAEPCNNPPQNRWDVALFDSKHSFVWKNAADLIDLLSPRQGERILDLGCGTGHLAHMIAASGAKVVAIDSDPGMIAQARKNYPDLRFEVANGTEFHFAEPFDAVFSNAVLHWIKEPNKVLACVSRALKLGGRFVAEFGGKGNVEKIVAAIYRAIETLGYPSNRELNPWFYPTVKEYTSLLEKHRFCVTYATLFDRSTPLEGGETGVANWIEMFTKDILSGVPADKRVEAIRRTEDLLRGELYRDGTWFADYRRIRVVAAKERDLPA